MRKSSCWRGLRSRWWLHIQRWLRNQCLPMSSWIPSERNWLHRYELHLSFICVLSLSSCYYMLQLMMMMRDTCIHSIIHTMLCVCVLLAIQAYACHFISLSLSLSCEQVTLLVSSRLFYTLRFRMQRRRRKKRERNCLLNRLIEKRKAAFNYTISLSLSERSSELIFLQTFFLLPRM